MLSKSHIEHKKMKLSTAKRFVTGYKQSASGRGVKRADPELLRAALKHFEESLRANVLIGKY